LQKFETGFQDAYTDVAGNHEGEGRGRIRKRVGREEERRGGGEEGRHKGKEKGRGKRQTVTEEGKGGGKRERSEKDTPMKFFPPPLLLDHGDMLRGRERGSGQGGRRREEGGGREEGEGRDTPMKFFPLPFLLDHGDVLGGRDVGQKADQFFVGGHFQAFPPFPREHEFDDFRNSEGLKKKLLRKRARHSREYGVNEKFNST
jgi:hypothetical protein